MGRAPLRLTVEKSEQGKRGVTASTKCLVCFLSVRSAVLLDQCRFHIYFFSAVDPLFFILCTIRPFNSTSFTNLALFWIYTCINVRGICAEQQHWKWWNKCTFRLSLYSVCLWTSHLFIFRLRVEFIVRFFFHSRASLFHLSCHAKCAWNLVRKTSTGKSL